MIAASASRVLGSSSTLNTCGMRLEFIQSVEGHTTQKASRRSLGRCMRAGRRQAEWALRETQVRRKMKVFPVSQMAPNASRNYCHIANLLLWGQPIIRLYQDETHAHGVRFD